MCVPAKENPNMGMLSATTIWLNTSNYMNKLHLAPFCGPCHANVWCRYAPHLLGQRADHVGKKIPRQYQILSCHHAIRITRHGAISEYSRPRCILWLEVTYQLTSKIYIR